MMYNVFIVTLCIKILEEIPLKDGNMRMTVFFYMRPHKCLQIVEDRGYSKYQGNLVLWSNHCAVRIFWRLGSLLNLRKTVTLMKLVVS